MKKQVALTILALFLLASCVGPGQATASTHREFVGLALYDDGSLAKNVKIALFKSGSDVPLASGMTNSQGRKSFGKRAVDAYVLRAWIGDLSGTSYCTMTPGLGPWVCVVKIKGIVPTVLTLPMPPPPPKCNVGDVKCTTNFIGVTCDVYGNWVKFDCSVNNAFCIDTVTKGCVGCRTDADCTSGYFCNNWNCAPKPVPQAPTVVPSVPTTTTITATGPGDYICTGCSGYSAKAGRIVSDENCLAYKCCNANSAKTQCYQGNGYKCSGCTLVNWYVSPPSSTTFGVLSYCQPPYGYTYTTASAVCV